MYKPQTLAESRQNDKYFVIHTLKRHTVCQQHIVVRNHILTHTCKNNKI